MLPQYLLRYFGNNIWLYQHKYLIQSRWNLNIIKIENIESLRLFFTLNLRFLCFLYHPTYHESESNFYTLQFCLTVPFISHGTINPVFDKLDLHIYQETNTDQVLLHAYTQTVESNVKGPLTFGQNIYIYVPVSAWFQLVNAGTNCNKN